MGQSFFYVPPCPERALGATGRHDRVRARVTATFLLIRHAEHGDYDLRLSGRRPGVPLSGRGRAQAAALATRLARAGIDRVEASPL